MLTRAAHDARPQLTSEYGPLSDGNAKAAKAYPITSESSKLEQQLLSERPMPDHLAALLSNSVELLKASLLPRARLLVPLMTQLQRALLLDYRDANRRQLQLSCMTYALNLPKEQILKFDAYKVLPHLIEVT